MGRIYDALQKAEGERQAGDGGRTDPTVVVDLGTPVGGEPLVFAANGRQAAPATERPDPSPAPVVRAPVGERPPSRPEAESLVAVTAPGSIGAERIRTIRSRVVRAFQSRGHRSLLVTSAGRGDGKSFIASNLALMLAAEAGRRVLLVDADLRKPSVARLFGLAGRAGLPEVLGGQIGWREAVQPAPWHDLGLLASRTRVQGAAEALGTPAMGQFVREARAEYDAVIVDAPPVLPVADSLVLAPLLDAVLLVARAGHTPRDAFLDATRALADVDLLGVVVNALPDPVGRGDYYYY
jgi:protein-tyrosine kinase